MNAVKNIRLKCYDYKTNGFYFVTIVTNYRQKFLIGKNKDVVARFIRHLGQSPGVVIDYSMIMPDHIHFILILNDCSLKLGEIIRRFKALTTHELGIRLWQPNYYEHVIRNENALYKIREYIQNNPEAERIKWSQFYEENVPKTSMAALLNRAIRQ